MEINAAPTSTHLFEHVSPELKAWMDAKIALSLKYSVSPVTTYEQRF